MTSIHEHLIHMCQDHLKPLSHARKRRDCTAYSLFNKKLGIANLRHHDCETLICRCLADWGVSSPTQSRSFQQKLESPAFYASFDPYQTGGVQSLWLAVNIDFALRCSSHPTAILSFLNSQLPCVGFSSQLSCARFLFQQSKHIATRRITSTSRIGSNRLRSPQ